MFQSLKHPVLYFSLFENSVTISESIQILLKSSCLGFYGILILLKLSASCCHHQRGSLKTSIYFVFELMVSNLHQEIKANDDLTYEHHQSFLYQMLRALKYMHTGNFLNILSFYFSCFSLVLVFV